MATYRMCVCVCMWAHVHQQIYQHKEEENISNWYIICIRVFVVPGKWMNRFKEITTIILCGKWYLQWVWFDFCLFIVCLFCWNFFVRIYEGFLDVKWLYDVLFFYIQVNIYDILVVVQLHPSGILNL